MAQNYSVLQGDHIFSIAAKFGFRDYRIIWDDPKNAALKQKRQNPHVLFPGDSVYIPDKKEKTESIATTKVHRFKLNEEPLKLRLVLRDFDNEPIPNMECELDVEGQVTKLKTNGKGLIEKEIPATAQKGVLKVPELGLELPVKIGHLDPNDEESGWKARLINLGYHPRGLADDDKEILGYSIEEFQCDHGLPVTGKLDAATKAKLKSEHGS
jgi:Putative peptidoglycan binding domain